ncbi:MAG TPA: DUF308 domain-containing protein [Candidatus Limnocylindrales bacterium]|jgi:uncharacterized membrane protein HdeD (DUF308 family)
MTSASVPATAAYDELPWWLGLVQGIALLVLGALCLSAPGATIVVLVQLTGLYWLITGILGLIGLISDRSGWLWKVFAGVIGILAGMAIVAHPLWSSILVPTTLVIVIGIFGIVNGILVMIQSWGVRRWSGVILGLVGALLGLVLVANPLIGAATLPFVLGLFAIVGGVMSIAMAWFERRARRAIASEELAPAQVAVPAAAAVDAAPAPDPAGAPAPAPEPAVPAEALAPAPAEPPPATPEAPAAESADDGGAAPSA